VRQGRRLTGATVATIGGPPVSSRPGPPAKSKSQRKREATALQALGERLVALPPARLAGLPLDETLRSAVLEAQCLSRGALRRQLQLVGKLMRGVDADVVEQALARLDQVRAADTAHLHLLEGWRDRLVAEGEAAVAALAARYPAVDTEALRPLVQAARERPQGRRALFRFLRESLGDEAEDSGTPSDHPSAGRECDHRDRE
jgi:ribosome-associated protein